MAGHSKFKNIMHRKKAVDAKRSKAFSKHGRLIMNAVKSGGADPAMNLALRYAMDRARADNMPNDAIQRCIDRASGSGDAAALEELTYEGYGPGGVAILVDCLTDNRNRTASDVRTAITKHGGNMGESGSVAWNFERRATFFVKASADAEEALLECVMEAGADDLEATDDGFEVRADPTLFHAVGEALLAAGHQPEQQEITAIAKTTVALDDAEQVQTLVRLLGALEDLDDVQSTSTNLEWTDEALAAAEAAA